MIETVELTKHAVNNGSSARPTRPPRPRGGTGDKVFRKRFSWIDTLLDNPAIPSRDHYAFGTDIQHRHAVWRGEGRKLS